MSWPCPSLQADTHDRQLALPLTVGGRHFTAITIHGRHNTAHTDTDNAHPGHRRVGGLLLIRNAHGHVLLVKPSYRDGWQLVGGAVPNELPHLAARRRVEETALSLTARPSHSRRQSPARTPN